MGMQLWWRFIVLAFLLTGAKAIFAQKTPFLEKSISFSGETLSPNGILPGSLRIYSGNTFLPLPLFQIDYIYGSITWDSLDYAPPLRVVYQVIPAHVRRKMSLKNRVHYQYARQGIDRFRVAKRKEDPVLIPGLELDGYIQRGVSSGQLSTSNTSELNLVLSGEIKGVKIEGVLSDNSLPFQPDGGTAQIQEFDRVYFQLSTPEAKLRIGDLVLQRRDSVGSHGGFQRNYRGAQIQTSLANGELEAGVGQGRGQFQRQLIPLFTGVSGPYRLIGAQNESSVIIIAGSEKVYINGKRLAVGEDYNINYQSGEIYFREGYNPVAEDQFIVEFQYTSRNYVRIGAFAEFQKDFEWGRVKTGFFREGDLRNRSLLFTPDSTDLQILKKGSTPYVNTDFDSFIGSNDQINLYRKDTINGDEVYAYSTDTTQQRYAVPFFYVGPGLGDYSLSSSSGLGPIYAFQNNPATGDFKAGKRLVSPKRDQWAYAEITSDTNSWGLSTEGKLYGSLKEDNLFQNTFREGIYGEANLGWQLSEFASVDQNTSYKSAWYEAPDPLIYYQKALDWGVSDSSLRDHEYLELGWTGKFKKEGRFAEVSPQFLRLNGEVVKAVGNVFSREVGNNTTVLQGRFYASELSNGFSGKQEFSSNWTQEKITWGGFGVWKKYNAEASLNPGGDFLRFGGKFSKSIPENKGSWGLTSYYQQDYSDQSLELVHLEPHFSWRGEILKHKVLGFYRMAKDNVGKGTYQLQGTARSGWIQFTQNWELGRELFQSPAFRFVEVPNGQGDYAYADFNGNGVREIEEFYLARYPDERNFIRLVSPSINYRPIWRVSMKEFVKIRPFVNQENILSDVFVSGYLELDRSVFSTLKWELNQFGSVTEIRREGMSVGLAEALGPFGDLGYNHQKTRSTNSNGFDQQVQFGPELNVGWSWSQSKIWGEIQVKERYVSSQYSLERNYAYPLQWAQISYQYTGGKGWSITPKIGRKLKRHVLSGTTQISTGGLSLSFLPQEKQTLDALTFLFEYVRVESPEITNLFLSNDLREGFDTGNNFQFQSSGAFRLNDYFEVRIDGGLRRVRERWLGAGSLVLRAAF
ncbi:MAG: hypothetical protein ACJAY8_000701 [Sphingobacteriales bacterium]|jgi:hypothetical protein